MPHAQFTFYEGDAIHYLSIAMIPGKINLEPK